MKWKQCVQKDCLDRTGRGSAWVIKRNKGFVMFKVKCASALSVVLTLCFGDPTLANDLPVGARTPSADRVASAYVGKTDLWKDNCGGGVYYSPSGIASGWCEENADSFAAGPWTIKDDGRLCTELKWYWPNPNGGAGFSSGGTQCIFHAADPLGGLWRSWNGKDWWRMRPSTSGLKSGYVFRSSVEDTRRRLGLK